MKSADVTPAQAHAIRLKLQSMLQYLGPLKHRMDQKGLPKDDPLYRRVEAAWNAVGSLEYECQCIERT